MTMDKPGTEKITTKFNLSSITPKVGSLSGGFVISIRGRNFSEKGLKVHFCYKGMSCKANAKIHFVSPSLLEVVCPNLSGFGHCPAKKLVQLRVESNSLGFASETRYLKVLETCTIVRNCMKQKGHDGRCCRDEGPPIYARQEPVKLQGGHFSTAMIGRRTQVIKKVNDVPVRPPPSRKEIPGGRFGNALIGYRLKMKPNSLPGPLPPPKNSLPGGGVISNAMIGYRTKKPKHQEGGPVRPPPRRKPIPGGRFGNAQIGYRLKNGFKPNSLPGPVNPPSYKIAGGGHFSTALIGYRTRKIKKINDVPVGNPPSRPHTPGGRIGTALLGYRTKQVNKGKNEYKNEKHIPIELQKFGANTPGGHFNLHGKDRSNTVSKRPQSAPMYKVRGVGETTLPGGAFNKSGAHKEMFRFTYLDEH
jgi:hypothetical protein